MKRELLPLFETITVSQLVKTNSYEQKNAWLIEILNMAMEKEKTFTKPKAKKLIEVLKNNSLQSISRPSLIFIANIFSKSLGRKKNNFNYYQKLFFDIVFGAAKPNKDPNKILWCDFNYKRLEQAALDSPNPNDRVFFFSGCSAYHDFLGHAMANKNIGVQIQLCSQAVIRLIVEHNKLGNRTFVDNGAFTAFRQGKEVDFSEVLKSYFELIELLENPELLTVVIPDRIADQEGSFLLVKKYREDICKLICLGVDVIIPIQSGKLLLAEAHQEIISIIGTPAFRVGVPSNKASYSINRVLEFVGATRAKRVHFLGLASNKIERYVSEIEKLSPGTHISSDATTLRAKLKKGSPLTKLIETKTKEAVEEVLLLGKGNFVSYQELVKRIFNQPNYLTKAQAKLLASFLAPSNEDEEQRIVFLALSGINGFINGSRLGDILERDYSTEIVERALRQFAEKLARRYVSGAIRAKAIAQTQTSTVSFHLDDLTCLPELAA